MIFQQDFIKFKSWLFLSFSRVRHGKGAWMCNFNPLNQIMFVFSKKLLILHILIEKSKSRNINYSIVIRQHKNIRPYLSVTLPKALYRVYMFIALMLNV